MAERLVQAGLEALGLGPRRALEGRGRQLEEKALLAALVRERSAMSNRRVADRLSMGSESSVTRAVRRVRVEKGLQVDYRKLGRMLELRDWPHLRGEIVGLEKGAWAGDLINAPE